MVIERKTGLKYCNSLILFFFFFLQFCSNLPLVTSVLFMRMIFSITTKCNNIRKYSCAKFIFRNIAIDLLFSVRNE